MQIKEVLKMKNKVLARIAASAISVAMLGTAVFAAETNLDTDKQDVKTAGAIVLTDKAAALGEQAQLTMMAYLVDSAATLDAFPAYVDEATTPMIALDQVDGSTGFAQVPINVSKLSEDKKIAVKFGCTSGDVVKGFIQLAGGKVEFVLGDVDGVEGISDEDVYVLSMYTSFLFDEIKEQYGIDVESEAFLKAADVDGVEGISDEDVYVLSMYTSFLFDEIKEQYGVSFGDME